MGYSPVWAAIGALLIIVSIYDFYSTTVTVSGSGPLSRRLARKVWMGFLLAHRHAASHRLLTVGGPFIMLMLILLWFGLCWLGWFLVFCGSESSVINAKTTVAATPLQRFYYAGYTFTTIGYGDFRAPHPAGQVVSILAGLNGLFLVTLAITYSIPVLSAAVSKRKLAKTIRTISGSTTGLVDRCYCEGDFQFLVDQLQQLTSSITEISEQHLAYPVLHYFHSPDPRGALPLNLVRLDEAITIVRIAFPQLPSSSRVQLETSQDVITDFMHILHGNFISSRGEIPAPPSCVSIGVLAQSTVSPRDLEAQIAQQERREMLLAYVRADGWEWEDVHSDTQGQHMDKVNKGNKGGEL